MKLSVQGHPAILWQCCSAAFQRCLRGKVVLSPSRMLKGDILARVFFVFFFVASSCVWAEWNCLDWWSKLASDILSS